MAIQCCYHLHKGSHVHITGRLQTRRWTEPNTGDVRLRIAIIASEMIFLEPLTHASEGAQEVSHARPDSFDRVGMDFADTIAVIITRPFTVSRSIANRLMASTRRCYVAIGRPRIGGDCRIITGMPFHERLKRGTIADVTNLQAELRAAPSNHTRNRWPIALPGSMATGFSGTAAGSVGNVGVFAAFLASVLVEFIGFSHSIR